MKKALTFRWGSSAFPFPIRPPKCSFYISIKFWRWWKQNFKKVFFQTFFSLSIILICIAKNNGNKYKMRSLTLLMDSLVSSMAPLLYHRKFECPHDHCTSWILSDWLSSRIFAGPGISRIFEYIIWRIFSLFASTIFRYAFYSEQFSVYKVYKYWMNFAPLYMSKSLQF